jgi:hypothetical protein
MEEKKVNTWSNQHVAFRLKWAAGCFILLVATILYIIAFATDTNRINFPEWAMSWGPVLGAGGYDAWMKVKKIKNGGK